jgi:hypothetical protein
MILKGEREERVPSRDVSDVLGALEGKGVDELGPPVLLRLAQFRKFRQNILRVADNGGWIVENLAQNVGTDPFAARTKTKEVNEGEEKREQEENGGRIEGEECQKR